MVYVWYMYGISLDIPYISNNVDIPCISKDIPCIFTKYIHGISMDIHGISFDVIYMVYPRISLAS